MPPAGEVEALLEAGGWRVVHRRVLPGRQGETMRPPAADLAPAAQRFLSQFPDGLFGHQMEALASFRQGRDVCLGTGTASGKTLAFQAVAIDLMARSIKGRVAVLYPLRALGHQQEGLWREAVRRAGMPIHVARVDGSVPMAERLRHLRQARLLILTPDVVHAWLLSNLAEPAVRQFLADLQLVILDEVHSYSGVFGANAAYLFRRLRYAVSRLSGGRQLRWFCASATMADPERHVTQLCGSRPAVVGPERDTSPRRAVEVLLVSPPPSTALNTSLGRLFSDLVTATPDRFLAFVDSRRQVESLAVIAARGAGPAGDHAPGGLPPSVLPYRSGYEEADRAQVQRWLQEGRLRGVVSTSALELGLDIGHLDVGLQVGVPRSVSTLRQRMGRIGRRRPGTFIVVAGGGPHDQLVLKEPRLLFDRPLPPSTVHLDNRRIQYIHAMCLAGEDGEAESLGVPEGWEPDDREAVTWPEGFQELCRLERRGSVPGELQGLKADGGADPWHTFPLRDAGTGFEVECRTAGGSGRERLGRVTYAQLMREAYPGAVYYYMARPYRVDAVFINQRKVVVSPERFCTTKPLQLPPTIHPNFGVRALAAERHGDLVAVETELQVTETVRGYEERRGASRISVAYPCRQWKRNVLRRNFFTTGTCLLHPLLDREGPALHCAAEALCDAFLLTVPTESADVSCGTGRLRHDGPWPRGTRFLALFDQTYGSLRLTSRLLRPGILVRCLQLAARLLEEAAGSGLGEAGEATRPSLGVAGYGSPAADCLSAARLLRFLAQDAETAGGSPPISLGAAEPSRGTGLGASPLAGRNPVILPGETGILLHGVAEEFVVDAVFHHPRDGLMYRGHRVGEPSGGPLTTSFPVARVRPIPGVTKLGTYDFETGQAVAGDAPV